jgi:adenylate cyclase
VKVRIGLNPGERIGGGSHLYSASAQVVRQICELAEPGQVVVSDAVRQLVAGKGFTLEPIGAVKMLKGLDEPVALYKLGLG